MRITADVSNIFIQPHPMTHTNCANSMIETVSVILQQNATSGAEQAGNFIADIQIGALLGFAATLLASFGVWYLNKWHRRKRLRKAVVAELEKQDERIGRIVESLETEEPESSEGSANYNVEASDLPPADSLPTTIYQANASNLGHLPSDEVESIVDYYSGIETQKATIEAIRNSEEVLTADKRDLHNEMPDLEEERGELITKLERGYIERRCE